MLFIGYPKCSTCQKAKNWLKQRQVPFEDRNIAEQNPTASELKDWWKKSGQPLKKFFNTSGKKYKELNLKERLAEMTEEEQIEILAQDGMLVKRPVLVGEDFVLTGFREEDWAEKIR